MAASPKKDWDAIAREFHEYVGYCVTFWARVDENLFTIFRACVGPLTASAIIYYRQPGLEMRFGLTGELVEAAIQTKPKEAGAHVHPDVLEWKAAIKDHNRLLGVRRRIAHQSVQIGIGKPFGPGDFEKALADAESTGIWPAPLPTFEIYARHEHLRFREKDQRPLRLPELKHHLQGVEKLNNRLHMFYHETFTKYARPSFP